MKVVNLITSFSLSGGRKPPKRCQASRVENQKLRTVNLLTFFKATHQSKRTTEDEMASLTWVWVNSGSWWWTGRAGVLQSMGSQSQTRLRDWTELKQSKSKSAFPTKATGVSGLWSHFLLKMFALLLLNLRCYMNNNDHVVSDRYKSSKSADRSCKKEE